MRLLLLLLLTLGHLTARAQTLLTDSLLIEGRYRVFHFVPPPKKHASVVFLIHGSGGNGRLFAQQFPTMPALAARENLALVFPSGYKTYWNECRKAATTPPNLENLNEQAFFEGMLQYLRRKYRVRDKKAFALGFSNGGHMAYKLALTLPRRFRAITAVGANLPTPDNLDCGEARLPVAVMIVNGTADPVSPYDGGEVKVPTLTLGTVRSSAETLRYWAELAGYHRLPVTRLLPDPDPSDGISIERISYEDDRAPDLVLLKVIGGQHAFPKGIDLGDEAWQFFQRQSRKR